MLKVFQQCGEWAGRIQLPIFFGQSLNASRDVGVPNLPFGVVVDMERGAGLGMKNGADMAKIEIEPGGVAVMEEILRKGVLLQDFCGKDTRSAGFPLNECIGVTGST